MFENLKTTNTTKGLLSLAFTVSALTFPLTNFAATQYSSNPTNWDNGTTAKWSSVSGGPYTSVWTNGNDAVFEGTGAQVGIAATGANAHNINFTVNSYQISANTLTLSGSAPTITVGNSLSTKITSAISGSSGLTKAGAGVLDVEGTPSWTGGTFIKEGTLAIGTSNDRLPTGGTVTLGDVSTSGTLQLGYVSGFGKNQTLAGLLATGNGGSVLPVTTGAATLTLNISSGTNTFAGTLGGAATQRNLALVKTGNGTLELTGSNTYTNATTVSAGALNTSTASTGGGSFTNNATLGVSIAGAGQSLKMSSLTLGAGTLNLTLGANNPTAPVITNSGALTLNGAVNVNVLGGASLTASDVTLIAYASGGAGTFTAGTLPTVSGYTTVLTNDTSNKQLKLVFLAAATPPSPTNITYSVTGNQLILNWPTGQGWQLQAQTNNLNTGLTTNWATIFGATPPFTNPINPANPSLFYRLLYASGNPPTTYLVTYNGNGNTGGNAPTDPNSPYASGATVAVPGNSGNMIKLGFIFAGWNTVVDGSGITYVQNSTFTIVSNTTLYAQWTPLTYTMTYNGNGSSSGSVPTDNNSPFINGATVTVLGNSGILAKVGYAFTNWNSAANGSGTSYTPGATFIITNSTTLYAQWQATGATYTVTYNGNGSTSGIAPTDNNSPYGSGATVSVLGNTGNLIKTGYSFANWNTSVSGNGTSYTPGSTFIISSNTPLYAQWVLGGTVTVAYDGNGNTGGLVPTDNSSPYTNGATVTVLGNTGGLTNVGFTFANWNTAANGSGISYNSGSTFIVSVNTRLYAQWSAIGTNLQYPYPRYNQGYCDPQLTGWPLTTAEFNYVTTNAEYKRWPGNEPGGTGQQNWLNLIPVTPSTQSPGGNPPWYVNLCSNQFAAILTNATPLDILLVGDSITDQWGPDGQGVTIWPQYYGQYYSINLGVGGDRTSSVLWRMDHAPFDHLVSPPKVVVLQIGNNNQYYLANGVTVDNNVQGVVWDLKNLRFHFPNTPIVWVNLFPVTASGSSSNLLNYRNALNLAGITNVLSTNYVSNVYPLDLWNQFASTNGVTAQTNLLISDGVHPSAAGYTVWATNMLPLVQQLVGH